MSISNLKALCNTMIALPFLCTALDCQAEFISSPPSNGAFTTGNYRNLAEELGKTDGASKLATAFDNMFGYNGVQQLYYPYSEGGVYKAHYIKAINPTAGDDVRTEGQSWAMTVAVMMDKQEEFDNLWRFAKNYQKNPDDHSDPKKQGVYAWQLKFDENGYVYKNDEGPAPDGEEYFAFALLNADARWGSSGEFNYYQDALEMLSTIKNKLMENNIIRFSPYIDNLTDPSYHIPAFYDYFSARVTEQSEKEYWSNIATNSRSFLKNHFASVTGDPHWNLPTYLAYLDGSPVIGELFDGQPNAGDLYEYDAWRVAMNVALDAHMMGAESWHMDVVNGILGFLSWDRSNSGDSCYKQLYSYGSAQTTDCAGGGQIAANAVALLASSNSEHASEFFNDFWSMSQPSGDWRYYNGSLYMLGMLHVTGNFRFYTSESSSGSSPSVGTSSTRLMNKYSGKCLDSAGTEDGSNVQQYECWTGIQQQWTLISQGDGTYSIQSNNSDKCLNVSNVSTENGANIEQWTCHYGAEQRFWLHDQDGEYFTLEASHSGKCLDVTGPSLDNEANIQQYDCHAGDGQQFKFD